MFKKFIVFCILLFVSSAFGISNETIIQITLSDSKNGVLQGIFPAKVSIIDHATNKVYWSERQSISFKDGFTELKLGPIDSFHDIELPRVILEIENNYLDFPIYPTLFAIHSKTAEQLVDQSALFIAKGNVGLGIKTPQEKLSIQGNLLFLGENDGIKFSNGQELTGSRFDSIASMLDSNSDSLLSISSEVKSITENIAAIKASINVIESASGANPIQVNTSVNNAILKIDTNGKIAPFNSFYVNDSSHYFLRTTNKELSATKFGSDFKINENTLELNSLDVLTLGNSTLSTPALGQGALRFSNGSYYVYQDNQWIKIANESNVSPFPMVQFESKILNSLSPSSGQGAMAYDGSNFFLWNGSWKKLMNYDFTTLTSSTSAANFLMLDNTGTPYKGQLAPNHALKIGTNGIQLNDQYLSDSALMYWKDNQLKAVTIGSNLEFSNGTIAFKSPLMFSSNAVGIGVDPTETLDVNGALRLRTQSLQSLSNVSAGSIVYDGSNFKGWDGSEWKSLSTSSVSTSNTHWTYGNNHLVSNPIGNVGIKAVNPQATLDVSGNLRIRSLPVHQSHNKFLVADTDGDVFTRTIQLGDLVSDSSQIKVNGSALEFGTMSANSNDLMVFSNDSWQPKPLTTDSSLVFNNFKLGVSTSNAISGEVLLFKNNAWYSESLTDNNSPIIFENFKLKLATQNATIGQQLTWNGSSWVPSRNEAVSYTGTNGIVINNSEIGFANNLDWSNNAFTIGSNAAASLKVNRMTSSLTSPIKVVDANDSTLLDINAAGQISIGFNGAHNGYSIASHGFNLFTHMLSRYQAAVGTTNIGSTEFGPTLLVHSIKYDNPAPSRSIVEVLSISGESRLEIQEGGNVGIKTGQPQATLDINGYAKLKKYSAEPTTCDISKEGSIALTSRYKLCACNGSTWVETSDGSTACAW